MNSSKSQMLDTLRLMLADVIRLRSHGAAYARLARAHGYVDGYMRALLESGVADNAELLRLVAEARRAVDGPAVGEVDLADPAELDTAAA